MVTNIDVSTYQLQPTEECNRKKVLILNRRKKNKHIGINIRYARPS